ncbi:MAG: PEGA domain-containing protein [Thermoplasmata archaeon]|nr:PEGA domain-containing protein [Thermoplasmata archaeon]
MKHSSIAVTLVFVFVLAGVLSVPASVGRTAGATSPALTLGVASVAPHVSGTASAPSAPAPQTTFTRTVLIETFTGVWCPHCPAETQALYYLDGVTSHNVLSIAELHVCGLPTDCLDNYVPPDGTSTARGTFYNVCGYPDVFFDGLHSVCGATNNESQMLSWYDQNITVAAAVPGNVSINETATVVSGNVTANVSITSGVTGTYNAVSYLLEYIGKVGVNNGGGPHSIGNVVRETLYNHPVNLTAGDTTQISPAGALLSSWNQENLSVVTFVQQNSTKIIQNANMVPVSTLGTTVTAAPTTIGSGGNSTITVHVTNLSSGVSVEGASVTLTTPSDGYFSPATGVTGADGSFATTWTAPLVSATLPVVISAEATVSGLVGFGTTTVTVIPYVPPTQPTGLTVTPGIAGVTLNWTAPSTGGGGVTYVVYEAISASGTYSEINVTTATMYVVTGLTTGHAYWYKVEAMDAGGYSPETPAIVATAVTGVSHGLPTSIGWWVSVDSMNFTSPTSADLVLYLPDGVYSYTYGTTYYARVASQLAPPALTVNGAATEFNATFAFSLATLQGTVSPANANVALNGTSVPIAGGAINEQVIAGTYELTVTDAGYQANTTNVTLAPGNTTTVTVSLAVLPSGNANPGTSNSGISGAELYGLIAAGAVAVVVVVAAIVLMSRKGKGGRSTRSGPK